MLDKVAHPLLISILMSWVTWGGVCVLGSRVEITLQVSENSILACSAIFLTASAVSFQRLCRSFVPVWITRY